MLKDTIFKTIIEFLFHELEIEKNIEITCEKSFKEVGLDSISIMMLFVYLEEQYGYETEEHVFVESKINSFEDLVNYIASKIAIETPK